MQEEYAQYEGTENLPKIQKLIVKQCNSIVEQLR